MNTYKINGKEFTINELTVAEMEEVLSLIGQLEMSGLSVKRVGEGDAKRIELSFNIMQILKSTSAFIGMSGAIKRLLAIALTDEAGNKETIEFFAKAKRSEVMEALKDFLSGEGNAIFTGIGDLLPFITGKNWLQKN
jgi:hypothetical protein